MKKNERILVLIAIGIGLMACNLGKITSTTDETAQALPASETPSSIQPTPTLVPNVIQPAEELEPCSLITNAEAEAILAEPASTPNIMNGSCAYSNARDALYTVSATAAQDQQTNGILQGQAMLLGFAGGQLDETRMNKLKTLAEVLDYKGFFAELVAAAEGSPTVTAKLVEGSDNDLTYWAWINAQSRRQGAFVAVRGQTVVNINLIVADTQSEESMLAASTSLADTIFGRLPAKFTLAVPTPAPTQQSQVIPTDTVLSLETTIIGSWERHSSEVTEYFNIQDDGNYFIEARSNSTNEVVTSINGTFTYDKNNIYYVDKDNHKSTESYYLDNEGDLLVINNEVERAWTRIK
jgi:hypothetical protein